MRRQRKELVAPLEAGKGKGADSPLEPPKGNSLAHTWILIQWDPFRLLPPEL